MPKKISDLTPSESVPNTGSFPFSNPVSGKDERITAENLRKDVDVTNIDSVDTLKTFEGKRDNQAVNLLGYYTGGDGGGGLLYWDASSTETANDGTIFQVTGLDTGRWKRPNQGFVNVRWFGAKGDNTTDDSTAMQNAVDEIYNINPRGGTLFIPSGRYVINTPFNPYKNVKFDLSGDVITTSQSPRWVKETVKIVGEPNTMLKASLNGSCIFPEHETPEAFFELEIENIRFLGTNKTGTAVKLDRSKVAPVRIKYSFCDISNFEFGHKYTPNDDIVGTSSQRNGFVHFSKCYLSENQVGLRLSEVDNCYLEDTFFESNTEFGANITTCVTFVMNGGKFQYNGDSEDNSTAQVRFGGTSRNIKFNGTYFEGGASSSEASNEGKGIATVILNDFVLSLSFDTCYFNGLKSQSVIKSSFGKIFGLKIDQCYITNYQLAPDKRLFQYTKGSTGQFDYSNYVYDNNTYGTMYDDLGEEITDSSYRWSLSNILDKDSFMSFQPSIINGVIDIFPDGVGGLRAAGSVAFLFTSGDTQIELLGSGVDLQATTGELTGTTGVDGKVTVSVHTDKKIYIENRLSGGGRNFNYKVRSR